MNGEYLKIDTARKIKNLEIKIKILTSVINKAKEKLAKPNMTETEKEVYNILKEIYE